MTSPWLQPFGLILIGVGLVALGWGLGQITRRLGLYVADFGGLLIVIGVLWGIAMSGQPREK